MKNILSNPLVLSLSAVAIFSVAPTSLMADLPTVTTFDLTASNSGVDVGSVSVYNNTDNLFVTYRIDDTLAFDPSAPLDEAQVGKWCITQTHTDVQDAWENIPQTRKGNPIPGKFGYKNGGGYCKASTIIEVENNWITGNEVDIAAHADVQKLISVEADLPGFKAALPVQVSMKVAYPGGDSYFNTSIFDTVLEGIYDGWCIDIGHTINPGTEYTADVYSSYEDYEVLDTIENIDKPENLDLVNYIINNYTGDNNPNTMCDIQKAIWTVVDDDPVAGCGSYNQDRVDEIVADAEVNGEDFVPACDAFAAVILVPVPVPSAQATIIPVRMECKGVWESETAWGGDFYNEETKFPGSSWGFYFPYTIQ